MKIIAGRYPEQKNYEAWITFESGKEINRILSYRVANYIQNEVRSKCSVFGYRSFKEQKRLYDLYIAGQGNIAAAPGKSRHNFGLAVDFNRIATVNGAGVYPGTLNADYQLWLAGKPETLNKYGLRHAVETEPWHVEALETAGVSIDNIAWFSDADDFVNTPTGYPVLELTEPHTQGNFVKFLQQKLGIGDDGVFGNGTDGEVKKYQSANGLTSDGVVGTGTWTALTTISCESCTQYKKQLADLQVVLKSKSDEIAVLSDSVKAKTTTISSLSLENTNLKSANATLVQEKLALANEVASKTSTITALQNENGMLERDNAELDKKIESDKFKIDTIDQRERDHKEIVDNLNEQIAILKINK